MHGLHQWADKTDNRLCLLDHSTFCAKTAYDKAATEHADCCISYSLNPVHLNQLRLIRSLVWTLPSESMISGCPSCQSGQLSETHDLVAHSQISYPPDRMPDLLM